MTIKELHDKLLAEKPEDAIHDAEVCPICNPNLHPSTELESLDDVEDSSIGGGDMKTYTEEEFTAAVQEAVAPLQAEAAGKVADLEAELEALKADKAKSEVDGQIAEVQAELDKAEIRVADAEARYDAIVAYLEAAVAEKAEAEAREARKDARIAAVKEVTALSDEVIEARLERWIAMSDEQFEEMIEDWKMIPTASHASEETGTKVPVETAMSNLRETENASESLGSTVIGARNRGIDVRYL